jgi:prolyl oligopeptidase
VRRLVALALVLASCTSSGKPEKEETVAPAERLAYPKTRTVDQVDDYHGTKVEDPYRWLEDTDSAETAAWVKAENEVTFGFLEKIPERTRIRERLTKLWNYERYGVPQKVGGRLFYFKNDGLQNQAVLYVMDQGQEARVLLDPNGLSRDGTVALGSYELSDDGNLMAYSLAASGSDWNEWLVRDVATGKDLPDRLKWIKFSGVSWTKDSKGFYYSRYDEPKPGKKLEEANFYNKLYFHRLGTSQSDDELVYKRDDEKEWGFGGNVTEDGQYLVITVWKGTDPKNQVFYEDLRDGTKVTELLTGFEHGFQFLGNDGPVFFFKTDKDAPHGRLVSIDTREPAAIKELVPQAKETIEAVTLVNDQFVVSYLKDAHSSIKAFDLTGKLVREVELPGLGSAGGFGGKRKDTETYYSFSSYTVPTTIYRYDLVTGQSGVWKKPTVDFNPDDYESKQVFYASKDGTKIPLFITHRKGLKLDGKNPTYLYGYGGFNISLTPYFSVRDLVWMEMGGVLAVANLRGGGEYGEEWHDAGRLAKKQNVFDDFVGAAEWLIASKYTSTPKLAIGGGSNGGLLVGACLTQRPELFGAALPDVGVMDMLRFHKFTIGWAWVDDYGSSDDPKGFATLHAYSPLHNVKPGTSYPPTLITTADHDDRVVPGHSFKFAATLQAAQAGPAPILIRVEVKAGHGAGKPTAKMIEETADEWAFLVKVLGVP